VVIWGLNCNFLFIFFLFLKEMGLAD
jgi:hypothetical protein